MEAGKTVEDRRETDRLLDEIEQLRTALEASFEEASRLAEDRDRLRRRVVEQARQLQAANSAYAQAVAPGLRVAAEPPASRSDEGDEELRVAFEEVQVLTEELEVANASLHETNRLLDRRVDERTRELAAKNLALHASELRFRTLIEGIPQLVWRSAAGGRWTWSSPQWSAYTGLGPAGSEGLGWLRALHPDDRARAEQAWSAADDGGPMEMEVRIFHKGERRYRHFRVRAQSARMAGGAVDEWLGTCTDVDDLLTLKQQQTVLVAELQHRTRNLMGLVQSILHRTLDGSPSLEAFAAAIGERMAALARVQGLLSQRGDTRQIAFEALLRAEIGAHVPLDDDGRGERVAIGGPADVCLRPAAVQTLALALHELMTNAIKYGALATPDGFLDVSWQLVDGAGGRRRLRIDWLESGVRDMPAPGAPPQGTGYGRELIEQALPYQLDAATSLVFAPGGVRCRIEVDVAEP